MEIIVALDTESKEKALEVLDILKDEVKIFKIGKKLFTKYGPKILEEVKKREVEIFLDLKFFDIPSIVKASLLGAFEMGVQIATVHSLGGIKMLREAVSARSSPEKMVFGVTLLTSLENQFVCEIFRRERKEVVLDLAEVCYKCGLDGVVCSGEEVELIKKTFGDALKVVIPGIRGKEEERDDQIYTMTPSMARKKGADYIVLGRTLWVGEDPLAKLRKIKKEIEGWKQK